MFKWVQSIFSRSDSMENHRQVRGSLASSSDPSESGESWVRPSQTIALAIASGKGGVGKSTFTRQLAAYLHTCGMRVGVLDADIYGPSQAFLFGEESLGLETVAESDKVRAPMIGGIRVMSAAWMMPKDRAAVVRAPIATQIIKQMIQNTEWGELDYLLLDLPPGTGDIPLSVAQLTRLNGMILITTPQELATGIAEKSLQLFEKTKVKCLGLVENMSGYECESCHHVNHPFATGAGARLSKKAGVPFLGAIPLDSALMHASERGSSLAFHGGSETVAKSALAIASIALELAKLLGQEESLVPLETVQFLEKNRLVSFRFLDGFQIQHAARLLRAACRCAECVDERTGERLVQLSKISETITVDAHGPVGTYALMFRFSDGHQTGIYSWEVLRDPELGVRPAKKLDKSVSPAVDQANQKSVDLNRIPGRLKSPLGLSEENIRAVLEQEINPALRAHQGRVELSELRDGIAVLRLSGGCQGCASSEVTLKQGIEKTLRVYFPELVGIEDATDHQAGVNPYFARSENTSRP